MKEKEVQQCFKQINDKLEVIQKIVIDLSNNQLSKDLQNLSSLIVLRKIMSVNEIMRHYGISRPWALRQMKKLCERHPYFNFIKGDKYLQRESKIEYCEKKQEQEVFNRIIELMDNDDEVIFARIRDVLAPFIGDDFERTKSWIYRFVDNHFEVYSIKDENKLCKRS